MSGEPIRMLELTENLSAIKGKVNRTPTFSNRMHQIMRTFQFKGAKASLSHYGRRALQVVLRKHEEEPIACDATVCDQRFAAESYDARLDDLAIQSPNAKWGLPYVPTQQDFFDKVVQSLPVRLEDYSFIDLGAGKGLALLLAANYPFSSITGVEYAKTLADLAADNIRAHQEENGTRSPIHCMWGDAADFQFPHEPAVLYLFNPFQGKVMDQVIANLENSLRTAPRDLWVIYGIPWEGRKFRRSAMFDTIEWNSDYSLHRSVRR
jgi:hypothetical protein